jgi:hypothetical protein
MKLVRALENLRPGSKWILHDSLFENIEWLDENTTQPSFEEITAEIDRITAEDASTQYKAQRAAEYPPFADYLDGIVKGDQAQIDAYVAACQAVKAKYPKP